MTDLRDALERYLAERVAEQAAAPETGFERRERLSQSFADALRPHLDQLDPAPPAPAGGDTPLASADELMAAIRKDAQE